MFLVRLVHTQPLPNIIYPECCAGSREEQNRDEGISRTDSVFPLRLFFRVVHFASSDELVSLGYFVARAKESFIGFVPAQQNFLR